MTDNTTGTTRRLATPPSGRPAAATPIRPVRVSKRYRTPVIDYTAQYLEELAARAASDSF
jgi:hypothetical protein